MSRKQYNSRNNISDVLIFQKSGSTTSFDPEIFFSSSSRRVSWRLIYSNTEVIDLFETNDITATPYSIFNAPTQDECFNKIDELKLTYYYTTGGTEVIIFSGGTRTITTKDEIWGN